MRLTVLLLAIALAGTATPVVAQPNFTTSTATFEPAKPVAGDVVRYTVTVTNRGSATSYSRVHSRLPPGFFIRAEGDCAGASIEDNGLVWFEGAFPAGATRRCIVHTLTRRDAAGTYAVLATEVNSPPGNYHRFEAMPELRSPPDPNAVRVGPVLVTRVGLVVLGVLALFIVGIPAVGALARRAEKELPPDARGRAGIAIGAWTATVACLGMLGFFAAMGYGDWRAYSTYRETSCTIVDSTIRAIESSKREGSTYAPLFALRYDIAGEKIYSSGYSTPTSLTSSSIGSAQAARERFYVSSVHPCWYDPDDPRTVLLDRRPGGMYFFVLLPLGALAFALVLLWGCIRRPDPKIEISPQSP
jgi:hypothetical protein